MLKQLRKCGPALCMGLLVGCSHSPRQVWTRQIDSSSQARATSNDVIDHRDDSAPLGKPHLFTALMGWGAASNAHALETPYADAPLTASADQNAEATDSPEIRDPVENPADDNGDRRLVDVQSPAGTEAAATAKDWANDEVHPRTGSTFADEIEADAQRHHEISEMEADPNHRVVAYSTVSQNAAATPETAAEVEESQPGALAGIETVATVEDKLVTTSDDQTASTEAPAAKTDAPATSDSEPAATDDAGVTAMHVPGTTVESSEDGPLSPTFVQKVAVAAEQPTMVAADGAGEATQIGSDLECYGDVCCTPRCVIPCQQPCQNSCDCWTEDCESCLAGTGLFPGIACGPCGHCHGLKWRDMQLIPWESLGQGEYIGPARLPHVPQYRLRVDDVVEFVYRLTQTKSLNPYKINVGDSLRIESLTADNLQRDLLVQPDGTITVRQLGQIPAAGRTIEELRADLETRYQPLVRNPSITVTPLVMNSQLQELRATIDARAGAGGQSRQSKVTPEGTIQLPAIGSVPAQGLTLSELKVEVEQRYNEIVSGLEITPILSQRAPRFVYVTGEVLQPGRYTLEAPTTLIQAIALAGSWNVGADLRSVVVLRRDENWQLMATRIDIHKAINGKEPCPAGEIWLRDSDIVLLPKSAILRTDDMIDLIFTRGIYGVMPVSYTLALRQLSTVP